MRKRGEYVYFIYRDIDCNNLSLTDFIGKVGRGTIERIKSYSTYFGSNGLKTYYIPIKDPSNVKTAEKYILRLCKEHDYLRRHESGRYSEVINISIDYSLSIVDIISKYKYLCDKVIQWISELSGLFNVEEKAVPLVAEQHVEDNVITLLPSDPIVQQHAEETLTVFSAIPRSYKQDREAFDTYIESSYENASHIYEDSWKKGNKEPVLNLVSVIKRTDDSQCKGMEIYNSLSILFKIGSRGTQELSRCIENKSEDIVLKFSTNHRKDAEFMDAITRLSTCYNVKPGYHFWKWLCQFLIGNLFFDCKFTEGARSGNTIVYRYHIDMSKWLWYYVKNHD